jgi:hypothetical protein
MSKRWQSSHIQGVLGPQLFRFSVHYLNANIVKTFLDMFEQISLIFSGCLACHGTKAPLPTDTDLNKCRYLVLTSTQAIKEGEILRMSFGDEKKDGHDARKKQTHLPQCVEIIPRPMYGVCLKDFARSITFSQGAEVDLSFRRSA